MGEDDDDDDQGLVTATTPINNKSASRDNNDDGLDQCATQKEMKNLVRALKEKEEHIAELERVVAELKRETLLPCKLCGLQDASGVNVTRPGLEQRMFMERDAREWGSLADTLLLVKPLWENSKATRIAAILPLSENRDLDPIGLVEKSNQLISELQSHLNRCERLRDAAQEADSSLFSLFPFSAGTFRRVAQEEITRAAERSAEAAPLNSPAKNYNHFKGLDSIQNKGTAVQVANQLLVEMTQALLEQRFETNAYIEELVCRALDKEHEMIASDPSLAPKHTFVRKTHQTRGASELSERGVSSNLMDDFLSEQEIEEDAAEVEL